MSIFERARRRSSIVPGTQFNIIDLTAERTRLSNLLRNVGDYYFRPDYITYQADTTLVPGGGHVSLRMVPIEGIPAAAAGKATFAVEAVMDNFQGGNGSNNTRTLESGKGNGKPYNITFKVDYKDGEEDKTNDVDMSAIGTTLYDDLFDKVPDGETAIASNHSAITTFEIGTANVGAGMNTLTITRNGSYNFIIRTIYVIL